MEVRAVAKHVPMSAQKVRLVVNQVRDMQVVQALEVLRFLPHAAARHVEQLVRSAVANAEENAGLSRDELYVAHIVADEGPGVLPGKGKRLKHCGEFRQRFIMI